MSVEKEMQTLAEQESGDAKVGASPGRNAES